jgi:hypothetical protein
VTKLRWGREKRGGVYTPEWQPRSDALIKRDLAALSSSWEGTPDQRREWARLKDELKTNHLLAERLS